MAQQTTLISKLDQLDRRYDEISALMSDSAVASDGAKIVALAKEQSQLGRIVMPYRKYLQVAKQYLEAQQFIDDSATDEDLSRWVKQMLTALEGTG